MPRVFSSSQSMLQTHVWRRVFHSTCRKHSKLVCV